MSYGVNNMADTLRELIDLTSTSEVLETLQNILEQKGLECPDCRQDAGAVRKAITYIERGHSARGFVRGE